MTYSLVQDTAGYVKNIVKNPAFLLGLVLQPASEAEEDEVCSSRQHPLASTLLPHKKSKFSILGAAVRGRPGEIYSQNLGKNIWFVTRG